MALVQSPHWPILIDVYFFLGGLAGGAFVIATVANLLDARRYREVVRVGYYLAFLALIPCPLILIVDLGVPLRFINMLLRFNSLSPMSMGAWALTGFGLAATLAALFTFLEDTRRARDLSTGKVIVGVIGGAFAFFLAAYPGVLLSATAQPLWLGGRALGALFLTVGASTGAAAMALALLLTGQRGGDGLARLRVMTVIALVLQIVCLALFVISIQASGTAAGLRALSTLTTGGLGAAFWGGALLIGSLLPLTLALIDLRRGSYGLTGAAAVLVLVGGFLVKYVIVAAGQA